MWHKPCRTFHPWCPCIKTRCLYLREGPTFRRVARKRGNQADDSGWQHLGPGVYFNRTCCESHRVVMYISCYYCVGLASTPKSCYSDSPAHLTHLLRPLCPVTVSATSFIHRLTCCNTWYNRFGNQILEDVLNYFHPAVTIFMFFSQCLSTIYPWLITESDDHLMERANVSCFQRSVLQKLRKSWYPVLKNRGKDISWWSNQINMFWIDKSADHRMINSCILPWAHWAFVGCWWFNHLISLHFFVCVCLPVCIIVRNGIFCTNKWWR